jgi:hypothetical protein
MVVHNPVNGGSTYSSARYMVVLNPVDGFLVVHIMVPVPILISTYYVPPKSGST